MKKVLYACNPIKDIDFFISKQIVEFLKQKNVLVYVEEKELASLCNVDLITLETVKEIDLAIVLGGDGTLLKYFRNHGDYEIPTIGINQGRVGALTTVNISEYQESLNKYFEGKFYLEKQFTLKGRIIYKGGNEKTFNIYNEVNIYRSPSLKLLPINVSINDCISDKIYADGMIVATPIGSSAYNLSAGGPLLTKNSECYVITPICPQIKNFSSLIVSKNDKAKLYLSSDSDEVIVSVDGCEKYQIGVGDVLEISVSKNMINLVKFSNDESGYHLIYKILDSIKK